MEFRDMLILAFIVVGVLALKGFVDAINLSVPFWVVYVLLFVVAFFSFVGLFIVLGKKADKGVRMPTLKTYFPIQRIRQSFHASVKLWLNWPGWVVLLAIWKVFDLWSTRTVSSLAGGVGLEIREIPGIGSPMSVLSILVVGVALVLATAPLLFIMGMKAGGSNVGVCQSCGSLHSPADNYCSNCGAALSRKGL